MTSKKFRSPHLLSILCLSSLLMIHFSCEKGDNAELVKKIEKDIVIPKSISNTGNVNFNTYDHDLNTTLDAETEFDNDINSWTSGLASVEMYAVDKGRLNFKLPETYGQGMKASIDVSNTFGYQMYFDVKFESGFDFSRGGKLGFGYAIGQGVTGGNSTAATVDYEGGSFRIMWYTNNNGTTYLYPYIYHADMPGTYGNELQNTNQYNITDNTNYRVRLTIKSNSTGSANDGYGKMEVSTNYGTNYTTVWEDSNMRWSGSTSEWERKITHIYFSTFRGGGDSNWSGSQETESIYFDNLKWYLYN